MRKLLPLILGLLGLVAGGGAGYVLRPHPSATTSEDAAAHGETKAAEGEAAPDAHAEAPKPEVADGGHDTGHGETDEHAAPFEYVKLNNQFVVPVISGDQVAALVVLSLTVEVKTGSGEQVFAAEPKLRDSFLQVLFDYANADGFNGAFTQSGRMEHLRKALLEPARSILGDKVEDVLIVDIVRQDN
jgi:flagellar protein FliL